MDLPAWMPVTIYAIIVLAFIAIYTWNHLDESAGRKPFALLALLVAFQLATDFVSRFYVFGGVPHWLVLSCTYINFLVLPLIGLSWYRFICMMLSEEGATVRKLNYLVYAFAAIGVLSLLANPITQSIFSFDAQGVYHRGPLFYIPATSAGLCMVVSQILLVYRSRMLGRRAVLVLLLFPVAPLIGSIAATQIYGLPWMPLGISISMVMLFASTFTSGMNTDYLTSVINRRRIEELLDYRIEAARMGRKFAGLMVDIDDFKTLNDTLGHGVGDEALSDTATLLQKSLRRTDVVGRFGGDEFFALLDVSNEEELESVVARIRDSELRFEGQEKPYLLRLSKGYAMFDPERFPDARSFENYLDELMYADKHAHKAAQE